MDAIAETGSGAERDDDQRVYLHDVPWWQYEALLAFRGEHATPRMTYLGGTVELMSPSRRHEQLSRRIGHLVQAYCLEQGIEVDACGSWTVRSAPRQAGLEPDECYVFGETPSDVPHLAIEIVKSHGGIDKLEAYRRLGVREVWLWRDDRIEVSILRGERYRRAQRSEALPGLDLALLARCLDMPTLSQAVRRFRAELDGARPTSGKRRRKRAE